MAERYLITLEVTQRRKLTHSELNELATRLREHANSAHPFRWGTQLLGAPSFDVASTRIVRDRSREEAGK